MYKIPRRLGLSYGSLAFFIAILHNVFLIYHVQTFVSVYKISKWSFWIGEFVFLIWNSVNDPLFGYLSDRGILAGRTISKSDIVGNRVQHLYFYGPLMAVAFLSFWFSWTYPVVQFIVCLCLYDGFLTMVDLHHSALLADLAISMKARTILNSYCSIFSCLGSVSVLISYFVWHQDRLQSFQIFCFCLSILSFMGFLFSANVLKNFISLQKKQEKNQESSM